MVLRLFNLYTLEQAEFPSEASADVPKYAVLSSVWQGLKDEVSYTEWQRMLHYKRLEQVNDAAMARDYDTIRRKPGFAKVEGFIAALRKQEPLIEWGWEYSCCVNSESNDEVDGAVLSGWSWLQNTAMCIVYLEDVPVLTDPLKAMPKPLLCANWFKRGWTLPELVAPREELFFDSAWNYLANRRNLSDVIFAITQVEERFLGGRRGSYADDISTTPAAQRLAWAAHRQTSKPEDRAYSLMGLLGVSVQPRYGEGGERAFARVLDCVLRERADQTVICWGFRMAGPWSLSGLLPASPRQYATCRTIRPLKTRPTVEVRPDPGGRGYLLTAKVVLPTAGHSGMLDHVYAVLDVGWVAPDRPAPRRLGLPLIPVRRNDPACDEFWRAPSCTPVAFRLRTLINEPGVRRTILVRSDAPPVAHLLSLRVLGLESSGYHGVLQEVWPPTVHVRDGAQYLPLDEGNDPDRTDQYIFLRMWTHYEDAILMIRYRGYWAADHTVQPYDPQSRVWPGPPNPSSPKLRNINPTHVEARCIGFGRWSGYKDPYPSMAEYFYWHPPTPAEMARLFDLAEGYVHHKCLSVERRPPGPPDVAYHQERLARGVPGAGLAPWELVVRYSHKITKPVDEIFLHERKP